MKLWKLTYELSNKFSLPVTRHSFSLRCFPQDLSVQKVDTCECEIHPCSVNTRGRDSFNNQILTGICEEPHDYFNVKVVAEVRTSNEALPDNTDPLKLGMYRYSSKYTGMGPELKKFYNNLPRTEKKDDWSRTGELMEALYDVFHYQTGSTCIYTTAEDAFAQGYGVCQDYAHILLSLCRKENILARYVAGAIPGEGESHAWIEVYQNGYWKGFDPTNNREANEEYIRFAFGRDAQDCGLNRGIFLGGASQLQSVFVKMEEC